MNPKNMKIRRKAETTMMNLELVETALLTVGVPVSHYFAAKKPDQYIVWAEDSQGDSLYQTGECKSKSYKGL